MVRFIDAPENIRDASVRLVTFAVRAPTMYPARVSRAEDPVHEQWRRQAEAGLADAVDHLTSMSLDRYQIEAQVAAGRSWAEAMEAISWQDGDVLVVGSSSTHRLAQVFLGSSATKIVRLSPVPVIVVPAVR